MQISRALYSDNAQLYVNTIGFWQQIRPDPDCVSRVAQMKPDVADTAKFGDPIFGLSLSSSRSSVYRRIRMARRKETASSFLHNNIQGKLLFMKNIGTLFRIFTGKERFC